MCVFIEKGFQEDLLGVLKLVVVGVRHLELWDLKKLCVYGTRGQNDNLRKLP